MAPDGTVIGEYDIPTPASGARCIAALADGRLFFTAYDAGAIGEVVCRLRDSAHPRGGPAFGNARFKISGEETP